MSLKKSIYEHLKTRKKYNTLMIKYETKCEELDNKIVQLNTEKRVKLKQQELYDEKIKELTQLNLRLKEENTKLKKDIKDLKKRSDK